MDARRSESPSVVSQPFRSQAIGIGPLQHTLRTQSSSNSLRNVGVPGTPSLTADGIDNAVAGNASQVGYTALEDSPDSPYASSPTYQTTSSQQQSSLAANVMALYNSAVAQHASSERVSQSSAAVGGPADSRNASVATAPASSTAGVNPHHPHHHQATTASVVPLPTVYTPRGAGSGMDGSDQALRASSRPTMVSAASQTDIPVFHTVDAATSTSRSLESVPGSSSVAQPSTSQPNPIQQQQPSSSHQTSRIATTGLLLPGHQLCPNCGTTIPPAFLADSADPSPTAPLFRSTTSASSIADAAGATMLSRSQTTRTARSDHSATSMPSSPATAGQHLHQSVPATRKPSTPASISSVHTAVKDVNVAMKFESLLNAPFTETKKLSSTPDRLKSIEDRKVDKMQARSAVVEADKGDSLLEMFKELDELAAKKEAAMSPVSQNQQQSPVLGQVSINGGPSNLASPLQTSAPHSSFVDNDHSASGQKAHDSPKITPVSLRTTTRAVPTYSLRAAVPRHAQTAVPVTGMEQMRPLGSSNESTNRSELSINGSITSGNSNSGKTRPRLATGGSTNSQIVSRSAAATKMGNKQAVANGNAVPFAFGAMHIASVSSTEITLPPNGLSSTEDLDIAENGATQQTELGDEFLPLHVGLSNDELGTADGGDPIDQMYSHFGTLCADMQYPVAANTTDRRIPTIADDDGEGDEGSSQGTTGLQPLALPIAVTPLNVSGSDDLQPQQQPQQQQQQQPQQLTQPTLVQHDSQTDTITEMKHRPSQRSIGRAESPSLSTAPTMVSASTKASKKLVARPEDVPGTEEQDDDEDDELFASVYGKKKKRKSQEMSLADFLRDFDPSEGKPAPVAETPTKQEAESRSKTWRRNVKLSNLIKRS